MFGRPFMGGLERKGIIATGTPEEIAGGGRACCTRPRSASSWAPTARCRGTNWDNLRAAIARRTTTADVRAQREANMATAIWWVRRDLRLNDNDALRAALAHNTDVVPVFVLDTTLLAAPDVAAKRVAFLWGGLRALDADLRARGSRLIVRHGDPAVELARLVAETGAEILCAEADPWPAATIAMQPSPRCCRCACCPASLRSRSIY